MRQVRTKTLTRWTQELRASALGAEPMDHQLNPRYTFDTFVVGRGNQFAYAAALAVADSPGKLHNPLFIYGSVGLGKTHLLEAIGHTITDKWKEMRFAYVCGETFANEFINACRHGRLASFRNNYRSLDVLLMDSVQFIAGKRRAESEFLHIFNRIEVQEYAPGDCLRPANCDVPCDGVDLRIATANWHGLRRKASYDGAAFDQQDCGSARE